MVFLFMLASVVTGARLHVIVMHLARHAYRKYFDQTDELRRSKRAQPSEYLPPIAVSSQVSQIERVTSQQSPHTSPAVSVHLKGESSMKHMKQVHPLSSPTTILYSSSCA